MHDQPRLQAPDPSGPDLRERPKDKPKEDEVPRGVAEVNFYVIEPTENG